MKSQKEKWSDYVDQLNRVIRHLKEVFVGKDEILDLMGICLVARENLFLLGPPGTAKSAMVRELAKRLKGNTFEYLLTRFTEPNELFGPFDIRKLREGDLLTNTEGMLPEAHLVFLDELLNANSAILNSLLMVLNERIFRRGRETRKLPALLMVGASNHLPEEEALQALFDRFLVRVRCDNVEPDQLDRVLDAGWKLEDINRAEPEEITIEAVQAVQGLLSGIDLDAIRPKYLELIRQLRNAGVKVSDRRAVKIQRLIAASAILCKRDKAILSDLWVMRYIWDAEEQREVIASIVNQAVDAEQDQDQAHPRASKRSLPNPEEIYQEITQLKEKWGNADTSQADRAAIKDRLRYLNGRSEWIANEVQRNFVQEPIDAFWKQILQSE
jgi:MoxR-like ATPase